MGYREKERLDSGLTYFQHERYPTIILVIHMHEDARIGDIAGSLYMQGLELDAFYEHLASL